MPHALSTSAATGGFSAALVSAVLRAVDPSPVIPPLLCQELQSGLDIHWPSVVLGVLLGLVLGQLLEGFILARHYLSLRLRQTWWTYSNALAIKQRGV